MEDYEKFVEQRLSHLRKSDEEHPKTWRASSVFCFHGQPILPPLLSGEKRKEMQQHRDAAQKAAMHRKMKGGAKMAYMQTLLQSVQLRKTPTLEELLQESDMNTKSSYSQNTSGGSVRQSSYFTGTTDSLLLSPPPERKEKHGASLLPLTSTKNSSFLASNVAAQQRHQDGCLINQHVSQQGSQPNSLNGASHRSVSSGYVTYENVENTISVFGEIDAGRESHSFGSSEGANNVGGFFLCGTSNTIAKMPDIISHPPVDGEELEKSGVELSFCEDFIAVKDIICSSLQEDSVLCDHLPEEKCETSHVDGTEGEDYLPITTVLDLDNDHISERNSGFTDISEFSQTLSAHDCPAADLHIQHKHTEPESADDHIAEAEPFVPYRLSLQGLLKKSQEYRRQQRMLRNQAKNAKIQERTQEKARARTEEGSLSDKENDEFPHKDSETAEGKKPKERRGTFIPSEETSPKKSWANQRTIDNKFLGKKNFKSESAHLTGDGDTKEMTNVKEETTFKNNKLKISKEVVMEPKQISSSHRQQPSLTEVSQLFKTTAFHRGAGKYHTIPAPDFCKSPVHFKKKSSTQDGGPADGANTSKSKVLVNTSFNEVSKVEEVSLEHHNGHKAGPCIVAERAVTKVSAQHIDQLESNIFGLKALISDLESTLTENFGNHSQTVSNMPSRFSVRGIEHLEQIKTEQHKQLSQSNCDYWQDKPRNGADSNDSEKCGELPRIQSLDDSENMLEDAGPQPSICGMDKLPLIMEVKGTEAVNLRELRLVKTLAMERAKEKGAGPSKSDRRDAECRKQQPPTKGILSVTQRLRVPEAFRNVPSETKAPYNHPVKGTEEDEAAAESPDCAHVPSLNQSYDVDAPSGLWFIDESKSDLGSRGRLDREKHLTPESGGEGQGEVSKVKRRLLMHMSEETQESSVDASGGAGSLVRPHSTTPPAAVRWRGGPGGQDKQEHLMEVHAAQVRALQDEHRRQRDHLIQALAVRYRLLQSASFPCSVSSSRLGDTLTFSTLSQPSSALSEHYRPLLLAAVTGFLTRRLLKTERVVQLVRTIRDTQQFLQALQQQSPVQKEFCSRQDVLLQERVTLQLRAARYEVSDIFFSLSAAERMQLISLDRELVRERALKRQSGHTGKPRGKSLSAATQKSLERKTRIMIQKKAAGRHRAAVTRNGHNAGFSAEQPQETKRGQFRANPQRVPKNTHSSRPR